MSINLNEEMYILISDEKEQDKLLLRHLTPTKCTCLLQSPMKQDSGDKYETPNPSFRTGADPACNNCEGHGWIFEEAIIEGKLFYPKHRVAHEQEYHYGTTQANIVHIYLPTNSINNRIHAGDIIFQLEADVDGSLIDPLIRTQKWLVNDVYTLRLDNNKLEFLKVFAKAIVV